MADLWTLRLARIAVSKRGFWGVAIAFSTVSAIACTLMLFAVAPSLDKKKLRALNSQLLWRAELAADHTLIALSELFQSGLVGCDTELIAQFRKTIYRYGSIKDVRSLQFLP